MYSFNETVNLMRLYSFLLCLSFILCVTYLKHWIFSQMCFIETWTFSLHIATNTSVCIATNTSVNLAHNLKDVDTGIGISTISVQTILSWQKYTTSNGISRYTLLVLIKVQTTHIIQCTDTSYNGISIYTCTIDLERNGFLCTTCRHTISGI